MLRALWRGWRELRSQPPSLVPLCKVRIFHTVSWKEPTSPGVTSSSFGASEMEFQSLQL